MPRKEANISKEALFKKIGYTPHSEEQWAFHNSGARFRIPCCGRRWGKSTASARELLHAAFIPDTYYWIVGPNYVTGEKEFRILRHDLVFKLKLNQDPKFRISNNVKQGDMRIELPWNTVIEVKSADRPDTLIGEGLDGLIVSEAAVHNRSTWEMQLQPTLADKRGWAIFPSTPRGYNWYQGMFMLGQDPNNPDYESWRFPTWTNTAMFPGGEFDSEILRIRGEVSPTFFKQEIAAEFTAYEGQIYEDWAYERHVTDIEYVPNWRSFQTFDFGFRDPFVCLDIMVDPEQNVYVWREYQVSGMTTWEHCDVLLKRENPPQYHCDGRFADPRGADGIATLELRIGQIQRPVVPWNQGIEAIRRWLKPQESTGKPKLFIDRSCVHLNRQMEQLRHLETKEGRNAKMGQHDYDDHGPDALRYFFGPYFVVGVAGSLSDVYGGGRMTEAQTFFQLHNGFVQEQRAASSY